MQWDFPTHSYYLKNSQESDFLIFYEFENDERFIETSFKIFITNFYSHKIGEK